MATKSKTIVLTSFGAQDNLQIVETERPKPKEGQVLVHIRAAGVNFAQLMYRQGLSSGTTSELPVVLGVEGAGDVCELGPEVNTFKCGERVMCVSRSGLWTEYAVIDLVNCFRMPSSMTYEEAAAIPVNYITAYHMLFDMAGLRGGKSVLVHMVAGGAGLAATQLIKSVPNTTIFGTCSAAKHETVRRLGVDHPIDYRTQDYVEEVRKVSPKGVDVVLDPLGGADSARGFKLLKPMGHIVHFGAANLVSGSSKSWWQMFKTYMATSSYNPLWLIPSNKGFHGYHLGHLWDFPDIIQEAVTSLMGLFQEGKIKPPIDSVWAFEDVEKAMERMQTRKNVGKMILCPQMKAGDTDVRTL